MDDDEKTCVFKIVRGNDNVITYTYNEQESSTNLLEAILKCGNPSDRPEIENIKGELMSLISKEEWLEVDGEAASCKVLELVLKKINDPTLPPEMDQVTKRVVKICLDGKTLKKIYQHEWNREKEDHNDLAWSLTTMLYLLARTQSKVDLFIKKQLQSMKLTKDQINLVLKHVGSYMAHVHNESVNESFLYFVNNLDTLSIDKLGELLANLIGFHIVLISSAQGSERSVSLYSPKGYTPSATETVAFLKRSSNTTVSGIKLFHLLENGSIYIENHWL